MQLRNALIASLAALAACSAPDLVGKCKTDAECDPPGSRCSPTDKGLACVRPEGQCYPNCPVGQACQAGECKNTSCPVCQDGFVCSPDTQYTCVAVTAPLVNVTSPGSNAFIGPNPQVTVHAVAPGGVTGLKVEVRRGTTVLGSAQALKTGTASDPDNWAIQFPLSGSATEGAATIVAIESWNKDGTPQTTESAAIPVTIDLTLPTVTMVSDGRTAGWVGPAAPATVTATITDNAGGSGIKTAQLQISGKPAINGTAGSNSQYTFTVPASATGVAAGTASQSVTFNIVGTDAAGNAKTLSGDPKQVMWVDLAPPTGTVTADATWRAANETVSVTGTANDASQSGLAGGAAKVTLTGGSFSNLVGTLSASTFTIPVNLSQATFGATEGPFNFTVTIMDAAGNASTAIAGAINVDNKAPVIGTPTVTTTPDDTVKFFQGSDSGNVTVSVTVKDGGSGVDRSTVALIATPPGAPAQGPIAGSFTSADADGTEHFTFTLPKAIGKQCGASANQNCDGSAPVDLKVTAYDKIAAGLTGNAKTAHHGTSASGSAWFDAVPPTLSIAADSTWHPATGAINVSVTINDAGSGGKVSTVALTDSVGAQSQINCAGNVCTFSVNAADMGAAEGNLLLVATGSDNVGNAGTGNGSRQVDGKAPVVTINNIYQTGSSASGAIRYPDAKTNTGYDGSHFFVSDSIHISATVTEGGSGVDASTIKFRIDGTGTGTAAAPSSGVSCNGDLTSCTVEVDVVLNGPNSGAFDQASGNYTVRLFANDRATNQGAAGSPPAVAATRFYWSKQVASNNTISGLAIHSNGNVIVTTAAGGSNDTVYALYNNGPFAADGSGCATGGVRWCYGSGDSIGSISSAPAIGEESSAGAQDSRIYIAAGAASQKFLALAASGPASGHAALLGNAGATFTTTPVVGRFTVSTVQTEVAAVGGNDGALYSLRESPPGTALVKSTAALSQDTFDVSSPAIVGGAIFAASNKAAQRTSIDSNGSFTAFANYSESATAMTGIIYGGTNLLYGAGAGASNAIPLQQFTAANPPARAWASDPDLGKAPSGDPILGNGVVFVSTLSPDKKVKQVTISNQAVATVQTYGNQANTPLLGSDGRLYLTLSDGNVHAVTLSGSCLASGNCSSQWNVKPGTSATAAPAMDCAGHLFVGIGDTVFAYITDAQGLSNTTWPKFHRDSRNSGNGDLTTLWGARVGGNCTQ